VDGRIFVLACARCTIPIMARSVFAFALLACLAYPTMATADECAPPVRVTWGGSGHAATAAQEESPVSRARELLVRAKFLDDAATLDDKMVTDITSRLTAMRLAAKVARDRADRATNDESLAAKAEELEADLTVSEAEVAFRKRTAAENRRVARELRVRAVRVVREAPVDDAVASACDPPFRFTADGRKIYRVECLK
jgi:hypothetical protein